MTMIVETGAVVNGANSYVTLAEADSYLRARGRSSDWDAYTPAQKEGLLIQATGYLDANVTWRGLQIATNQALGWPRSDVIDWYDFPVDPNIVPEKVKFATIEIASHGLIETTVERLVESESVGPISVKYAPGSDISLTFARFRYANSLVRGLVRSAGGMIRLSRA